MRNIPRVDSESRVQVRIKAPDATKVKVNFWSGPKMDMEKQPDGFWTVTTPPQAPGLHYYAINIDGVEVNDPGSHYFTAAARMPARLKFLRRARPTTCRRMFRTARFAKSGTTRA